MISPVPGFVSPDTIFIQVVLPLPFSPSSPYIFPFSIFSVRSATASFDPNHFVNPLHSSIIFRFLLIICDLFDDIALFKSQPVHLMHKILNQFRCHLFLQILKHTLLL